jgi:hypothetical protein
MNPKLFPVPKSNEVEEVDGPPFRPPLL